MEFDSRSFKKRFNVYLSNMEYQDFVYLKGKFQEDSLNGTFLKMLDLYVKHYRKKEQEASSVVQVAQQ